jgi:hypothetical protein
VYGFFVWCLLLIIWNGLFWWKDAYVIGFVLLSSVAVLLNSSLCRYSPFGSDCDVPRCITIAVDYFIRAIVEPFFATAVFSTLCRI